MRRFRVLFAAALIGLTGLTASTFAVPAVSAVTPTTLYAVDAGHSTVVKFVGWPPGNSPAR